MLGALVMTLTGAVLVGGGVVRARYAGSVHQAALLSPASRAGSAGVTSGGAPVNLLLIGIDPRVETANPDARSDSIIIVHVPRGRDRAFLVSIPRDLVVDIPAAPAAALGPTGDRINAAYARGSANGGGRAGGMRLLSATITALTGIRFDAEATAQAASNPLKLDSLVRAVGHALTVDTNGLSLEQLAFGLRGITSTSLVGIRVPSYPQMIGNVSYVLPYDAADGLYTALHSDRLRSWVKAHPEWANHL